jgi:hypothetical protein
MAGMPGNIAKGRLLLEFDDFINGSRSNLRDALAYYKNDMANDLYDVVDFGVAKNILKGTDRDDHILKHWLVEAIPGSSPISPQPWWPTFRPMGKVLRKGLIRALETCEYEDADANPQVARASALPLDSYWLCAGSHFEIVTTVGYAFVGGTRVPHHVNLLILSPSVPVTRREGNLPRFEDIWVVKHSDDASPGEQAIGWTAPSDHVATVRLKREKRLGEP